MGTPPSRDDSLGAWLTRAGTVLNAHEPIPPMHQQPTEDMDDGGFGNANGPGYVFSSPRGVPSQGVLQRQAVETTGLG